MKGEVAKLKANTAAKKVKVWVDKLFNYLFDKCTWFWTCATN